MKLFRLLFALSLLVVPLSVGTGCEAEVGDRGPNGIEVEIDN